ncbi:F0F1 ATP synthase subunit gamma [Pantoea sp. Mhis]|uniref:F0F1 ATP synthase subunit gamma n=1 Tax=Pantoea sp. Mhis TaxID=2576759 RepID=UPI00135AD0E7|nr:F0F1 ATP synthase subunit gamma [Pantoea sp. Mhis]MXP56750.1 F0F1 ATP synthase subunit gamma [Pantoea sp. Mhis]
MCKQKEINTKILAVKNTQKITKAMEMVAASKMRKTQQYMNAGRPYANNIKKVINHLALGNLEYKHLYLTKRNIKKIGYLIISTDRGLCGSLNINLFKKILLEMKNWSSQGVKNNLAIIGSKGLSFFSSIGSNIIAQVTGVSDHPLLLDLIGPVKIMLQNYEEGCIDKIYIASNKFSNTMCQIPTIIQLLPLASSQENEEKIKEKSWDYLYEPDSKVLLDMIIQRYIESQVYQSVIENLASEQAARMVAMKTAADNAGNIIKELQLIYNKARQASITQELTEIVSGASVV